MPIAFAILNRRCQVNSPAKSAKTAKNHRKIGITMLYHWDNPNPTVQSCPGWLICIGHHICTSVSEAYQKRRVKMKAKSSLPAKIAKAYCWWNFKNFFCEIGWRDIDSEAFFRNYMLDLYILDPYHGPDRWERPSCGGVHSLAAVLLCRASASVVSSVSPSWHFTKMLWHISESDVMMDTLPSCVHWYRTVFRFGGGALAVVSLVEKIAAVTKTQALPTPMTAHIVFDASNAHRDRHIQTQYHHHRCHPSSGSWILHCRMAQLSCSWCIRIQLFLSAAALPALPTSDFCFSRLTLH